MKITTIAAIIILALKSSFAIDKPNIIIFVVDDMGLMDTSLPLLTDKDGLDQKFPLNSWYKTPNMERLAKSGIRFSNFYAHTVCSPSRLSIMTGQNSARHRTTTYISPTSNNGGKFSPPEWNWKGLTTSDITLPKVLKKEGYRTIHVGKAHFGPIGSEGANPLNLGFDINIAGCAVGRPGSYYSEDHFGGKLPSQKTWAIPGLEKYYDSSTFLTEAITVEAKHEIAKAASKDKPFYLYMSHYAVHAPFQADPRFSSHYEGSDIGAKGEAFATLIEGMDRSLGDILDCLDSLSISENTLILFLGDNGSDAPIGDPDEIACSAPLRGKKGSKWEGGTRVPFIASWAEPKSDNDNQKRFKIKEGAIQSQIGRCYDIFPTVIELIGATTPSSYTVDGESLSRMLTGKTDKKRTDRFLSHFPHYHRSNMFTTYREDNWKIIYHYMLDDNDQNRYSLYDLNSDPSESEDLSSQHPKMVRSLMVKMVADLERKGALYPTDGEIEFKPIIPEL